MRNHPNRRVGGPVHKQIRVRNHHLVLHHNLRVPTRRRSSCTSCSVRQHRHPGHQVARFSCRALEQGHQDCAIVSHRQKTLPRENRRKKCHDFDASRNVAVTPNNRYLEYCFTHPSPITSTDLDLGCLLMRALFVFVFPQASPSLMSVSCNLPFFSPTICISSFLVLTYRRPFMTNFQNA